MPPHTRKAYEVSDFEVQDFFRLEDSGALLSAPLEHFPSEHHYLIRAYRNAFQAGGQQPLDRAAALNVVRRFHRSIRVELLTATDDERALKQRAFGRVHQLCLQYQIAHPELSFALRGVKAGTANESRVRLNYALYVEHADDFVGQVIPHELCHTWKRQLGLPGTHHGSQWKKLMHRMGVPPLVTHSMDVSQTQVRTTLIHSYACGCPRPYLVSPRKHYRIQTLPRPSCKRCKQPVRYVGIDAAAAERARALLQKQA